MEQYTLNRFYFEAKAILEKYQLQNKPDYKFEVAFLMEERQSDELPELNCRIWYSPHKYDSSEKTYSGFGVTPYICLGEFEETLKKATGKPFIENLSVELSKPQKKFKETVKSL